MPVETIGIYSKADISSISLPNTLPNPYPINVGTAWKSIAINNLSPYFISLSTTGGGMPFATISPWTITPVNLDDIGMIYVSINGQLGTINTGSQYLSQNEQIFASLSTSENYNQMIQLSPNVNISNSVSTDMGVGMQRDPNGGIFYAQASGILTVTFSNEVSQIYIQHRGQAGNIYVTGDEDPSFNTAGITMSAGDALGLSWKTKNLYFKADNASTPVQAQGWS